MRAAGVFTRQLRKVDGGQHICKRQKIQRRFNAAQPSAPAVPVPEVRLDQIAVQVEYKGLWNAVLTFPKRKPFAFGIGLNAGTCFGADWVQQKFVEKRTEVDGFRSLSFLTFGFMQGMTAWYVYMHLFKKICPNTIHFANLTFREKLRHKPGQRDLVKQVLLDNSFYATVCYFPNFYFVKSLIGCGKDTDIIEVASEASRMYITNFIEDNKKSCCFWLPFDIVNFAVPAWARLPTMVLGNFGWTSIMSYTRGAEDIKPSDAASKLPAI